MSAATFFGMQLLSTDKDRATAFYEKVFGWQMTSQSLGFSTFPCPLPQENQDVKSAASGVIMQHPMWGMPSAWFLYVQVENLPQILLDVTESGGQILQPPSPSPLGGVLAVITDPTGAVLGLFEPLATASEAAS